MRIPVSHADLHEGRITDIARLLKKAWPSHVSLMQAQNIVARDVMGYRNLRELQQCVATAVPPAPELRSREAIRAQVAWRLARRHALPLLSAAQLASKLHLETLSADAATSDAAFEAARRQAGQSGKQLLIDESWRLFDDHWDPRTPALLDAGLPGFRYAVLPGGQIFQWSALERLLDRVPDSYHDDLRMEDQYHGMTDEEIDHAFYRNELYPQACSPLVETITSAQILPTGFAIIWVFDKHGACLGRALHNHAIGGLIPVLYGVGDDTIFEAVGTLLQGKVIPPMRGSQPPQETRGETLYTLRYGNRGYSLERDLSTLRTGGERVRTKAEPRDLVPLAGETAWRLIDGRPALSGPCFTEAGQLYIRLQTWMAPHDVPEMVLRAQDMPASMKRAGVDQFGQSHETLPRIALALHQLATDRCNDAFAAAEQQLREPGGLTELATLFANMITPAAFDAYCNAAIHEHLPTRYDGDEEDNGELMDERKRSITSMASDGARIKTVLPALAGIADTSLALVLLLQHNEYPGSRHSWFVRGPDAGDTRAQLHFLAALIYHAQLCLTQTKHPEQAVAGEIVLFAVARVLAGRSTISSLLPECATLTQFHHQLRDQGAFIARATAWQAGEEKMRQVRRDGKFLYVGEEVPRTKPKSMTDYFQWSRSKNAAPLMATQTLSSLR